MHERPHHPTDRLAWWDALRYGQRGPPATAAPASGTAAAEAEPPSPPASRYVPPELWDDNTTAAELKWERRVQFDAQRGGNGVRQNEILQKAIGLE